MTLTLESARLRLLVVTFAAGVLTVGCGGGNVLQSPTGPSGTASSDALATSSVAGGAASSADVFDTLDKGGSPGGKKPGDAGESEHGKGPGDASESEHGGKPEDAGDHGRGHEDRVVGFVSAKFADTLTVNGITVAGGPGVVIRHGNRTLTMADIQVGDHIQARGTMNGTTLVATEIKVEDTGNDNDENQAELKGTVSAFSGAATCPAATFMIGTTKVTTSATTVFDDVTCATLADGAIVEVEGTRQADGSILATKVEGEAGPDEVEGMIFALAGTGSCPALTFKVGSTLATATTVNTNSLTTFNGVTCAALANGARVEVEGTKQADGSITAASVELH
jgi:uncharacterized protein DUF5666